MCFDLDSRPPIAEIAGGALDSTELILEAADGNRFRAFRARATTASGAGIVILPDVRGLHPFYEELALRFAENGVDALAFDFFGRTAGTGSRDTGFEFMPHVEQVTWAGVSADIRAAARNLRMDDERRVEALFTTGFCFGGRLAYLTATLGLGLAGTIGFYGIPVGPGRAGTPAPADVADQMTNPILGLWAGADAATSPEAVDQFDRALSAAGVEHRFVTFEGAPHSFFDRKADEFADASTRAWDEMLTFVRGHTPSPVGGG
ncbi:MAG TPA: dienelactone hydrolase family protein [Verrucomicrobiae bacterium]|jgi:carboxymethylenebutenolidase|nr:dienelactone hydrolase family protein [Verrucomicrobiae bacterium]